MRCRLYVVRNFKRWGGTTSKIQKLGAVSDGLLKRALDNSRESIPGYPSTYGPEMVSHENTMRDRNS